MPLHNNDVDFGFEKIAASVKTERISRLFDRVSSKYDLMNDLMSFGIHRLWKTWFVQSLPLHHEGTYLDVAGGTGDIAAAIDARLQKYGFMGTHLVCDLTPAMMQEGQQKAPHLSWVCGNAEELPLNDNSVDVYTIAFGLRNVTHKTQALKEAYRVLRPGGTFACLEFSHPIEPLRKAYDFYSFEIIPCLGEWVANDRASYQYLSESIRTFPTQEALASLMTEAGFRHVTFESYTGGVVAVHRGMKAVRRRGDPATPKASPWREPLWRDHAEAFGVGGV